MPIGVIYDLLAPHRGQIPPPWPLTLHFTGYPSATLPPYNGEFPLRTSFMNSLKEASFIASSTATPVMNMVPQSREDLWESVRSGNIQRYHQVLHSIPLRSPDGLDAVPVRLYIRTNSGSSTSEGGYLSSYEGAITQSSRPLPVNNSESGEPVSFSEALAPMIARWVASQRAHIRKKGGKSEEEDGSTSISTESTTPSSSVLVEESKEESISSAWDKVEMALVGGVEPSPEMLLRDLHAALHCPDFFLYIVLQMKPLR